MNIQTGVRGHQGQLVTRRNGDWNAPASMGQMNVRVEEADPVTGHFEGWGCVFGVEDSYGTTFQRGCFEAGGLDEGTYPLLAMHSPAIPLGVFTAEERKEGLWIDGQYDETPTAAEWRTRALSGSAPELSVGFIWRNSDPDDEDLITDARLVETSQITLRMGAVPGAAFSSLSSKASAEARDAALATLVGLALPSTEQERAMVERAQALLALRLADL